ncbi:diacylglycerol kinase [Aureimonas flava]|uniref:Dihydrofolate reductase n=1 Tax=Aureimonas flava TaxID=2320271 RepID=A0A3A1WEG7_9HYPH|nr:dihydrofolate reductase [Aureimonas flava]RIX97593.1 diacylglycerol kinase [Aureimonas flava]
MTRALPLVAVVAVVATAANGVIGLRGAMPWSIPSDLKRYRALTMGKPMIMGRRTLESIGRVLDGRDTIVLTRAASLPFEGAIPARSPAEALALAARAADRRGANEIVIAGGAQIYREFLPSTDRVERTVIDASPDGDAFFPDLEAAGFALAAREPGPGGPRDSAPTWYERWERT